MLDVLRFSCRPSSRQAWRVENVRTGLNVEGSSSIASLRSVSTACSRPTSRKRALRRCSRSACQILSVTSFVQITSMASRRFHWSSRWTREEHRNRLRIHPRAAAAARTGMRDRPEGPEAPSPDCGSSLQRLLPLVYAPGPSGADRRTLKWCDRGAEHALARTVGLRKILPQRQLPRILTKFGRTKPICYIIRAPSGSDP